MDFETPKSHVYIKVDEHGRITRCEGEYTLPSDLTDWTLIEEGAPCDRLNLAQSHYFDGGLYTLDGVPRYKLADGAPALRTEEEIAADSVPAETPSDPVADLAEENKLLKQRVSALTEQQSFYEDCIAEMAAVVYA